MTNLAFLSTATAYSLHDASFRQPLKTSMGLKTTSFTGRLTRAHIRRGDNVAQVVPLKMGDDTKFVEPQPGEFADDLPKPTVSEQGLAQKAAGDGTAAKVKAENDPAWMDTDSFKPADPEDSSNYSTSVKIPELEQEAKEMKEGSG